jgi:hypothetical protein
MILVELGSEPAQYSGDLQEGVDGSCGGGKQRLLLYEKRLG